MKLGVILYLSRGNLSEEETPRKFCRCDAKCATLDREVVADFWDRGTLVDDLLWILFVAGLLCLLAGAVGGGVKLLGNEVGRFDSVGRSFVIFVLGVLLIGAAYAVHVQERFRVSAVSVSWDAKLVSNCGSKQDATVFITTAGSGGGSVWYRLLIDGAPLPQATLQTDTAKTYDVTPKVAVAAKDADEQGVVTVAVEILSPNHMVSASSEMPVQCQKSSDADEKLRSQVVAFFVDYSEAVKKYGKASGEVTENYYSYPLHWYRHRPDFASAAQYVKYATGGNNAKPKHKLPAPPPSTDASPARSQSPSPPSPSADASPTASTSATSQTTPTVTASVTPSAKRNHAKRTNSDAGVTCTYGKAFVTSVQNYGDEVRVTTRIDWQKSDATDSGHVIVRYQLVKSSGKVPFKIRAVDQDNYDGGC